MYFILLKENTELYDRIKSNEMSVLSLEYQKGRKWFFSPEGY